MATALTECWGTWRNVGTGVETLVCLHAECFLDDIGIQLTGTRQGAVQLAMDILQVCYTTYHILDERLAFLNDEHFLAFVHQTAHQLLGQGILRNLQNGVGASVGEALRDVVVAYAAGQYAQFLVAAFYIFIIYGIDGILFQLSLLGGDNVITLAGVGRQQHPVLGFGIIVEGLLLAGLVSTLHHST